MDAQIITNDTLISKKKTKKNYSYGEVFEASKKYFNGDDLAAKVFVDKYALVDSEENYHELTPDDLHKRLAKEFARIEAKYPNPMSEDEIYDLMKEFKYIVPQGSPMSAIGNEFQIQSLSNCFVIDGIYSEKFDSYGGIFLADQEQAQIMKRRGGVGFDISGLRPKGLPTNNAAKTTDGIAVFMERFSNTTREVAQGSRRGALILTIDCSHYEVETFIDIKKDLKKVTGANISIKISDDFMRAVRNNEDFELKWPVNSKIPVISKKIRAKELWDKIVDSAWSFAEPGLLFWDNIINYTPSDIFADKGFITRCVNPCSELPLNSYDACRLLLINTTSYVNNAFKQSASFDYDLFYKHSKKAQKLMDDMVDLEIEQINKILKKIDNDKEGENLKAVEKNLWSKIKETIKNGRRTGLGITGLGDTLAMLGVRYGSKESINETEKIYKHMAIASNESSVLMAEERGAFPIWDNRNVDEHPFMRRLFNASPEWIKEKYYKTGRRNIALTTTAPAGSVSTLTQTTSGIEPAFLLKYKRRKKINSSDKNSRIDFKDDLGDKWQEYDVSQHGFEKWMEVSGEVEIEKSPYFKSTSSDIDWISSVDIQAAAQKWVEHAISKTCNVPENTQKEIIAEVYMRAWEKGLKGFTVYRDKSRSGVLVSHTEDEKKKNDVALILKENHAPKRPEALECDIHYIKIKGEEWLVMVGLLDGKPYEIFGGKASMIEISKKLVKGVLIKNPRKTTHSRYDLVVGTNGDTIKIKDIVGQFENEAYGTLTRMISLSLRHGTPIVYVCEQLVKNEGEDLFSFSKVLARTLKKYIPDGLSPSGDKKCKQCEQESLVYHEGCLSCKNCGWSKC